MQNNEVMDFVVQSSNGGTTKYVAKSVYDALLAENVRLQEQINHSQKSYNVISSAEYSGAAFGYVPEYKYEAALKEIETLKSQNAMLRSLNDSALELADTANGQLATATQEYHKTVQQLDAEISQLYSQIAALEKDADLQSYMGGEEDWKSYLPILEEIAEDSEVADLLLRVEELENANLHLRLVLARELEHLL